MNTRLSSLFLFLALACNTTFYATDLPSNLSALDAAMKNPPTSASAPSSSSTISNTAQKTWDWLTNTFSHDNQRDVVRVIHKIKLLQIAIALVGGAMTSCKKLSDPLPPEIANAVEKMGMKEKATFYEASTRNIGIAVINGAVIIDPEFYSAATPEERTFVIGHELTHLHDYHHFKKLAFIIGSEVAIPAALQCCKSAIDWILKKGKKSDLIKKYPSLAQYLDKAKTVNHAILKSPFLEELLVVYSDTLVSQHFEKSADLESARILNCHQGGISFFKKFLHDENSTSWLSYINAFLRKTENLLGINSHPSNQERIEYLEKAAKVSLG